MILVRDIFQVKFGKAREAVAVAQEGQALFAKHGYDASRILTDLVGPTFYTLVFESSFDSMADYESSMGKGRSDEAWQAWYAKFMPLIEGGRREILTVVE